MPKCNVHQIVYEGEVCPQCVDELNEGMAI